jgi:hypothetical protein
MGNIRDLPSAGRLFLIGSLVRTPSGRKAEVTGYAGERLNLRYLGGIPEDIVSLKPSIKGLRLLGSDE